MNDTQSGNAARPADADPKIPYRKVLPHMWTDTKFRALSSQPSAQLLWNYLLTGPCTTQLPGVIVRGRAALAEELGWEPEDFQRCWSEIEAQGMAHADWKARLVWLPNAMRYNPPANPNVVKGWAHVWAEMPDCELKARIRGALQWHMHERGESFVGAFDFVLSPRARTTPRKGSRNGSANRMANQDQDQDQDQEQEQEGSPPPAASGGTPLGSLQGPEAEEPDEPGVSAITHAQVIAIFKAEYERTKKAAYVPDGKEHAAVKKILKRSDATPEEVKLRSRRGLRSTGFERGCSSIMDVNSKWLRLTRGEGKYTGSKWAAGGQNLDGCSVCREKPCVCEVETSTTPTSKKVYAPVSDFSKPGNDTW